MTTLRLPPLSLYIHIPWCERKCPYCDFNSHEPRGDLPEHRYIEALLDDLQRDRRFVQERHLHSIFIGGGTPSLLSVTGLTRLLQGVADQVPLVPDCEITLEANPGSAEAEKFAGFAEAGVNRLSLGVQSFDDEHLARLGRIHNGDQALRAVEAARTAGVRNLNIDLMHGLPGQRAATAAADLTRALALAPEHLSWYQLTIERNTAFWKNPPALPAEPELARIQTSGEAMLAEAGYENYEVSAYARAGSRSRHNLNYWLFGDYIGIGAGAHGKVTQPGRAEVLRTAKRRQPTDYLAGTGETFIAREEPVAPGELAGDFMLNALRLTDGFELALFEERTGLARQVIEPTIADLQFRRLLDVTEGRVRTTALGRQFLDDVVAEFI